MEHPTSSVAEPTPGQSRVPKAVLVVGGAIVALIALGLVAVLVAQKGPATYAPGSPEAAFQAFYRAYEAGDVDGAYGLLSSAVTGQLTLAEYRRSDSEMAWERDQDRRVVLVGADLTGDRANLRLRIDQFSTGGLGAERYSYDRTVRLVWEAGAWLIDEPIVGIENVAQAH